MLPHPRRPRALAGLLGSADPPPSCAVYRGVLTPTELDAPQDEIEALISGAAVHDLGWLRRVAVRGERPLPLAERHGHQHGEGLGLRRGAPGTWCSMPRGGSRGT